MSQRLTRAELDKLIDTGQITFNRSVNKSRPYGRTMPDWRNSFIGIAEHLRNESGQPMAQQHRKRGST